MASKTARNPVTKVMDGATVQTDEISTAIETQRIADESGFVQLVLNQDPNPGGGSVGDFVVEGRASEDADWAAIPDQTFPISDLDGMSPPIGKILANVPMMYAMRVAFRNSVSVAGGTTPEVWIAE